MKVSHKQVMISWQQCEPHVKEDLSLNSEREREPFSFNLLSFIFFHLTILSTFLIEYKWTSDFSSHFLFVWILLSACVFPPLVYRATVTKKTGKRCYTKLLMQDTRPSERKCTEFIAKSHPKRNIFDALVRLKLWLWPVVQIFTIV